MKEGIEKNTQVTQIKPTKVVFFVGSNLVSISWDLMGWKETEMQLKIFSCTK